MSERIVRIGYPEFLDTTRMVPYARFCDAMDDMGKACLEFAYRLRVANELMEEDP